MEEAEAALVEGAAAFGASDWHAALAQLADAHPTIEQFPARFAEVWSESRAVAEAHDLLTIPDWPVRFEPQPAWVRPAAPSLYFIPYRSPAPFDPPPYGTQYIPTIDASDPAEQERRLRAANDQVIKQNYIVHHAGIGHHAQNWYAMRAASRIGQIAAVDCASRIAMLCGGTLAEGWASYVTDLMDEVGFLTPLESFAQQYARLRMAARTVVDVRLHDGRFSLEDAAALLPRPGRHGVGRRRVRGGQEHPLPGHRLHVPGRLGRHPALAPGGRGPRRQRLLARAVPRPAAGVRVGPGLADRGRDAGDQPVRDSVGPETGADALTPRNPWSEPR